VTMMCPFDSSSDRAILVACGVGGKGVSTNP
jgi:hypothetical protein